MKNLGILVPIVIPCSRDGKIDLSGFKGVCQEMLETGCDNIFIAGSTGRGPWFSRNDRVKICRAAADLVRGKSPVFAGCMASGLPEMLENAKTMADAGADIAVLTAPGYFNYSHPEIETIFREFADRSPLPVLVYDIPVFAGVKLDLNMVIRLSRHQNVIGFKDSSGDAERFRKMTRVFKELRDFYLLQGKEHLLWESLQAGASGFVVSLIHMDPRPFAALYAAARSGEAKTAEEMQKAITKVMQLIVKSFKRRPEVSTMFHFINFALRRRRVCDNILLEHEGDCPKWLAANAAEAVEICAETVKLTQEKR